MRRSEVNAAIDHALLFFGKHSFLLPPWAKWSPADWKAKGQEVREIRTNGLGWDLTDFGSGDFDKTGLLLFTVRNGKQTDPLSKKPYAEKIMIAKHRQTTPIHFHWSKMEDIINRGGADLVMRLWKADSHDRLSDEEFTAQVDGVTRAVKPGAELRLSPGESITLEQRVYHTFWADGGECLIGEVSMVNDDSSDNRFFEPVGRFPKIDEDVPAKYLLCNEYK